MVFISRYNYKNIRRKYKISKFLNQKLDSDTQKIIDFIDDNFINLKFVSTDVDVVVIKNNRTSIGYVDVNNISIELEKIYSRIDGFNFSFKNDDFRDLIKQVFYYHYKLDVDIWFSFQATNK